MISDYPLFHKAGKLLSAAAERMTGWERRAAAVSGKLPELSALLFYAAAHLCMALVHEPFFDEAEAWQIARSVPLRTLLLETTHYEGHPPLWHLVLMPFAKAGAPYELSLALLSLAFTGTAVFLILWYAPFPRLVRLLLPFTYFYFYQYGVISRVYCVMTLAFVLLAMAYRRRNERPGGYVAALLLLCVTMAYGLVIAGGLALVWLWEIWKEKARERDGRDGGKAGGQSVKKTIYNLITDRRMQWLAVLLMAALGVIWQIMPRADTYAVASAASETIRNPFPVRLLYTFLVLPADAVATDVYSEHMILARAFLPPSALVSGVLVGLLVWGLLLYYGRKRGTTLLLLLPYSLFALFSALVYVSLHHIGIGLLYFCFWCWASAETVPPGAYAADGEETGGRKETPPARERSLHVEKAVRCAAVLCGTAAMGISLFWTGAACVLDIGKSYAPGRKEAAFIRAHHLEQYRMMTGWLVEYDEAGNVRTADINECDLAVNLAPYFEHNLFFNFNGGRDEGNYITHIRFSEEETRRQYEKWRRQEPPQILWMSPDLAAVYGGAVKMQDYALVYQGDAWQVWKAGADYYGSEIHVRRDLLEETGLSPLSFRRTENGDD